MEGWGWRWAGRCLVGVALPGVKAAGSGLPEGCGSKSAESLERLEHILPAGANPLPAPNPWGTNSAGKAKELLTH